jgi:glycosyltransferase involved in cell wall biosynthesis
MSKGKILQVCAIDLSIDALLKPLIMKSMAEGYTVHNVCTDNGRFERLKQDGLIMIDIKINRKISLISNLKSIFYLYKLMKKEKYDIVHVHTPIAALLGRIAAKLAGVKIVVYTAHGFYFHEEMSELKYKIFYNIEKYAAKFLTDWLLLQSKEDYELSIKNRFLDQEKIIHISNGVDVHKKFNLSLIDDDTKEILKQNLKLKENDIVFCFIGRLVREKGILELLEAFNKLQSEFNNVKLLLIGSLLDSERDKEGDNIIKKQLSNTNIIHLGFRKDTPELLAISDVFVLPSYREGLPRSIIEAMAMRTPIIATNIRGCREEVFSNKNGYLVDKASTQSLYNAMRLLFLDKDKRTEFGISSRAIAEELFDENKVIEKQIKLFDSLI